MTATAPSLAPPDYALRSALFVKIERAFGAVCAAELDYRHDPARWNAEILIHRIEDLTQLLGTRRTVLRGRHIFGTSA